METEPLPAFKLANSFMRMTLEAFQDELGENGLNVLLNYAELYYLVDNMPLNNLEHEISFKHYSAIQAALVAIYGVRTANTFSFRAGRTLYEKGLNRYGALGGLTSNQFQALPELERVELSLYALAKVLNSLSNQNAVVRKRLDRWYLIFNNCPVCWGLSTDEPICSISRGIITATLETAANESDFVVEQAQSHSAGDQACIFGITKNTA